MIWYIMTLRCTLQLSVMFALQYFLGLCQFIKSVGTASDLENYARFKYMYVTVSMIDACNPDWPIGHITT